MEKLLLVFWVIFYPLSTELSTYFFVKQRNLRGAKVTQKEINRTVIFEIFAFVAVMIYILWG